MFDVGVTIDSLLVDSEPERRTGEGWIFEQVG